MLHAPPHLKAAFATDSLTCVDTDLSQARHIVFYDITPDQAQFLDVLECRRPGTGLAGIEGCGVLFSTGLTEHEALRIGQISTFSVVVERRRAIQDIITRLQMLMRRDPPLWMCRVLHYGALPQSVLAQSAQPQSAPPPESAAHDSL